MVSFRRPILMQLNDISSEIDNEFYKDHRGIAKLIGCDDLCRDLEGCDNPIDRLVTHWIRKNDKATLLDLLNYILKIGRSDIYKSINVVLGKFDTFSVLAIFKLGAF